MTIRILNKQTLKITLSTNDMQKYNITNDMIKNSEKITRSTIFKIIGKFKENIETDKIKNNIFLEAFKTKEKGCILLINLPTKTKTKNTKNENKTIPIIAVFKTTTNLKNLCKNIKNICRKEILKSTLYELNEKLIFTLEVEKKEEPKISALIKEFAQLSSKGEIKNRMIKEHYKPIYKENAIDNILKTIT